MASRTLPYPLSLFDVSDRAVVITGASGAFGRAVAVALGSLGCRLLLASGSQDRLDEVVERVRALSGASGRVETYVGRPDSLRDAEAITGAAVEAFGAADGLVVASGVNKPALIQDQDPDAWQEVMDANVRGPWLMAKAFGAQAIARGRAGHPRGSTGKVLLVSSVRGRHGNAAGYTAYSTSKGATDALTRVLATEWGRYGINVNAIAPTVFRSNLTAWIFEDDEAGRDSRRRNLSRIPLGRLAEPEDFVGMAIYLMSPASDYCSGQVIYIDGGYTAA